MKRICREQYLSSSHWEGGNYPGCGIEYDDEHQSTICPHRKLHPLDGNPWGIVQMIAELAQYERVYWPRRGDLAGIVKEQNIRSI